MILFLRFFLRVIAISSILLVICWRNRWNRCRSCGINGPWTDRSLCRLLTSYIRAVTIRTLTFRLKENFTTIQAFRYFPGYFYATTRTSVCLVANLTTTFWTFNDCHCFVICFFYSLMSVANLTQSVSTHKTAFVYIRVYSVDATFSCVLPQYIITTVCQSRFTTGILGYHQLIIANFS